MNNKLISFLVPTRNRIAYLKNCINSIIKNVDDCSGIEIVFRVDDDDINTISAIKDLPFDNLYINNKKINYSKNTNFNKCVDMHFLIGPREKGYEQSHEWFNEMFKIASGKWIFSSSDDVEMLSKDWYSEIKRIDSLNKICVIETDQWYILIIHRKIPELLGYVCKVHAVDIWYSEITNYLNIGEKSTISVGHIHANGGQTTIDREVFRRNEDFPPYYMGKVPEIFKNEVQKLKEYIYGIPQDINENYSQQLDEFFQSLASVDLNKNKLNTEFNKKDTMQITFINGPKLEISGNSGTEYMAEFIDIDTNSVVHRGIITPGCWIKANRQWFTNWKIKVYDTDLIYEENYNATDKKVYIHLASESIGDTLAWFPYIEEFRKKHNCKMVCSTFHNYLFEDLYKDIQFVKPGTTVYDLYAMYEIGIYEGENKEFRNKTDHKNIPLQQVAADVLGLEFREIRPDIKVKNSYNKIPGKYVVIATESTAQCKLWNYPDGWQKVVDYLNNKGYKVVVVQKEMTNLKNVIHRVGNKNLEVAIDIINGAEFFIGISSGLSWIAWALQKKTIMISGFTLPWYEFNENCYRIYNQHSCKGCWHEFEFDKGDWNWCPRKKNFECSSTILPENVYAQIETIINELDVVYTVKSPNEPINLTNSSIGFKFGDNRFTDAESIFYEIFRNRTYDFKECRINENDIVLDLGANIGIFTRYARACRAKQIYSFEPIIENYNLFFKNNNIPSVISYNIGVSNDYRIEEFHIDSTTGGHTISEIDINHTRTKETRQIQCYSLDYMFETAIIPEEIDFMKIDTEGAEIKILDGISDENLLKINKIAMEWHQFLFEDKKPLESILSRFTRLGYTFYIDNIGPHLMTIYFWKS